MEPLYHQQQRYDNNTNKSTMKITFPTILIASLAATATAHDSVWARGGEYGECKWLYQTVDHFSLPPPNLVWDVNVICGNPNRRRLKGGSSDGVYNHEVFADHFGRVFSDDGEACLDVNLGNGNVIMRECPISSLQLPPSQTWIVVPLTTYPDMVLFENRATQTCIQRHTNPNGMNLETAECDLDEPLQMFRKPDAGDFFDVTQTV